MSSFDRIDTHAHFIPPAYRIACEQAGHGKPDGMPAIPPWTEEAHLQLMKDCNITKSVISISSPGTHLIPGDSESARKLTRDCNEYAAEIVRRRPQEFGFWASLPLQDVAACLEEIPHSLDKLRANGFAIHTNHEGKYPGDSAFDPVFDELNRRKAKVFIHPTSPCSQDSHGTPKKFTALSQFPNPMFEFLFDTARAVINLFLSGTIKRCPNITWVIPHAGGALPPLVERFCNFATSILDLELDMSSKVVKEALQRQFYFDLAGFPFPDQIQGLLRLVDSSRLLYGSDYPFTPTRGIAGLVISMEAGMEGLFTEEEKKSIRTGNAQRLLSS